ncbi:MAG: hypothetical protein ACPGUD_11625 [Parashewanella sp.]
MNLITKCLILCFLVFLPLSSVQAITVKFTASPNTRLPTIKITLNEYVGFHNVASNIQSPDDYQFRVALKSDPSKTVTFFGPNNSNITYSNEVNNVNYSGSTVKWLKMKVHVNDLIVTNYHNVEPGSNVEVDLYMTSNGGETISSPAQRVTNSSIPVQFSGGNGSPLNMYIEADVHFKNINTKGDKKSSPITNGIYLGLKSKHAQLPDLKHGVKVNPLKIYDGLGKVHSLPHNSRLYMDKLSNTIYISGLQLNYFDWNNILHQKSFKEIGILPNALQTISVDYYYQWELDNFLHKAPQTGWYEPFLYTAYRDTEQDTNDYKLPPKLKKIGSNPKIESRPVDKQLIDLITHVNKSDFNRYFDPKLLGNNLAHERFFIVSSYDNDGRIQLKSLGNTKGADPKFSFKLTFFDFADGDRTPYGSSVRWFSSDKSGKLVLREGYLGWHDPHGKYAFLKLHNGEPARGEHAPKIGTVFSFNWAKPLP